jgi:hypothetical protein
MFRLNRIFRSPVSKAARHAVVASLAIFAFGCTQPYTYLYRPSVNATASTDGYPAARYPIPLNAPKGDVRVASFGVTEVGHEQGPDLPSLHIRLAIANNAGQTTWTVDTRDVRVELRGEQPRGPAFANAEAGGLPVVGIPPEQQRTIDLFYPLPKERDEPEDIPAFDVLWKVQTDEGMVAERTPFEQLQIERVPPVHLRVGLASYWWYDPWYPGYTILPPAVIVRSRVAPPPRVHIRTPPHWRR